MSSPMPEWCPYCMAEAQDIQVTGTRYTCGSQVSSTDGIGMTIQRDMCRVRELEQLREKVKLFTEVLADPAAVWANMLRGTIAMPPHIPKLRGKLTDADARIEELERSEAALLERVKRLEAAGDKLIDAVYSVQCWSGTHVGDCADEFESVKGQP